jgi:hypothetical protein
VHIKNGIIIGKRVDSYAQDLFLGIPFAQAPVGDLRFGLPKPLNQTWETPFNASSYGPMCINYPVALPMDISATLCSPLDAVTLAKYGPSMAYHATATDSTPSLQIPTQ